MASPTNPFTSGGDYVGSGSGSGGASGAVFIGDGGTLEVAKPPTVLLAAAAGIAAGGIVLGAIGWDSWVAIVGWFLAGPVAIGVLAFYVHQDTARRAMATYVRPDRIGVLYGAVALMLIAGIVVSALGVGLWVGHR